MSPAATPTDGWATTDLWTMVGGIAAALAVVGPVIVWAFRTARQRRAQYGPRVGRGVPVRARVASADEPAEKLDGPLGGRRLWNVPPPVRSFTGRDEHLALLRAQLTAERSAALVPATALHGIGGVGKTQLALAYAHQHRQDYWLGWWIPAESELTITTALAQLAGELGLPTDLPQHDLAARLAALLADQGGWLLVFDDATGPATLGPFLPRTGIGHVLVTSRNPAWHGVADSLAVDVLSPDEAAALLRQRSGDPDEQTARALAGALGGLPLALEQAGAYASQHHLPLIAYLELFARRRAGLLARGAPLAYHGTVDATFSLALDRLRAADPAAAQLVELCGLLAPDELPVPLLLSQPELLPEPLATAATDRLRRGEVVGVAYQMGLLAHGADGGARMHRLVQAVTLAHLPDADRYQRIGEAAALLAELSPSQPWEPDQWPRCARLLAHAHAVTDHARTLQLDSRALALLLLRTGTYAHARGLLPLAQALHEQALAMHQRLHDGDHPAVATTLSNLASDLAQQGDHERARLLDEQALTMRQRLYDGDHPAVAGSLGNLAVDLRQAGQYERARALDEQALAMRRRLYDGDHPDLALSLGNLATDLRELGEHGAARQLHEQALAMCQRLYDGDHPAVAERLGNLAVDLRELGECERAGTLDEQALAMRQRLTRSDLTFDAETSRVAFVIPAWMPAVAGPTTPRDSPGIISATWWHQEPPDRAV